MFFIDFKSAFDNVIRYNLFYKIRESGVTTKIMRLIRELYTDTTSCIWNGDCLSSYYQMGLRQGCVLRTMLVNLFLNDMHDFIAGGIYIDNMKIRILMYADDIVMLAEDNEVLQMMIDKLEEYCRTWNLVVNLNKSKIMIFGRQNLNKNKYTYMNSEIEVVTEYKYLGIILTPHLIVESTFY